MPASHPSNEIAQSIEGCETIGMIRSGRVADTFHVRVQSRDLCLRVLRPDLLDDHNSNLQFRNEYKALMEIDHPGFLKAGDWNEVEGVPCYLTEYFPHDSLRERLSADLADDAKRAIFTQIVEACAHIHDSNMVHFGVKPENVLYSNGQVKLVQVGQVRFLNEDLEYPDLFVTEGYTDPEVISGRSGVSKRSDVYSVSAVGVFILGGEDGLRQQALADPAFGEVLKRGLEGEFNDCSEMLAAMTKETGGAKLERSAAASPASQPKKKFRPAMAAAALVVLAGLYWAWPFIAKQVGAVATKPSSLQGSDAPLVLQKPLPPLPHLAEDSERAEFWQFIGAFNKLPADATTEAVAVYRAQGVVNQFPYKQMGERSVLGDVAGLTKHYKAKYASGAPLAVPSSFGTDYQAMLTECWEVMGELSVQDDTSAYVAQFRNWIAISDYMATYGDLSDKKFALKLMRKLYSTAMFNVSRIDGLEAGPVHKAVHDIYLPLMDSFREDVSDLDLRYVSSVLKTVGDKGQYANFLKWALRNDFELYGDPNNFDLYDTLVIESNNLFVDVGLFEYSIYWVHSCYGKVKLGAPFDQAIRQNFRQKIKDKTLLEKYQKLKETET